jgi:hypothetical protein
VELVAETAVADAILDRVEARVGEIGVLLAERYRVEIPDYGLLSSRAFENDLVTMAITNLEELVADVRAGSPVPEERLERFRASAVRRANQGVSIHALLHAYRLWGRTAWEEILRAVDVGDPRECIAALAMAGRVMSHVDTVSAAVVAAYLDAIAGVGHERDVIRRDLLEVLISGQAASESARRKAMALNFDAYSDHVVVLARAVGRASLSGSALHDALGLVRTHLRPDTDSLLVGVRDDELVALYPVGGRPECKVLERQAQELAAALDSFCVGIGRRHDGVQGIGRSYAEAQEALDIAISTGVAGRAIGFGDVALDHIVRSSVHSEALLADILTPIREYDQERRANLMATLRAYFDTGFNLTRSAATLNVHPNTVVYRLRRIAELTGRDATDPNDLLLLVLGLKLAELGGPAQLPPTA